MTYIGFMEVNIKQSCAATLVICDSIYFENNGLKEYFPASIV